MTGLYEGAPDARQTDARGLGAEPTLFRKRTRQLAFEEIAIHDAIKDKAEELAGLIRKVGCAGFGVDPHPNAEVRDNVARAIAHLEDAVYRAVKALTR